MKDVKLITFHKALSYGGCLQAYASVKIFQSLGCDVTVIDYENEYEARKRNGMLRKYGSLQERFLDFIKNVFFQNEFCKRKAFGKFIDYYPSLLYMSGNKTQENEIVADILVVGSDQVWNGTITNGVDRMMLLDFGTAKKRLSFASSMGSYQLKQNEREMFARLLKEFTSISVREEYAKKQLSALTEKSIKLVADPTLLLTKESWIEEAQKKKTAETTPKGKYILAFVITPRKENLGEVFTYYKNKLGVPVYRIMLNTYKSAGVDKVIAGPTPFDFVNLIANAEFVITDSFHGTAFSINLNKPFILLPVKGNNDRMSELLEKCQLSSRMWAADYYPDTSCDFTGANHYLSEIREDNLNWIKMAIE